MLIDSVSAVLREVGSSIILPRFLKLRTNEIDEKGPADPVTIADREAEQAIASRLIDLVSGSRVIGEEACSSDASLLEGLDEGAVWIVDPIDGTSNFIAGTAPFASMVALLEHGQIRMSWIHDPLTGRMACAESGSGAWLDGSRLVSSGARRLGEGLSGIVSRFCLPDDERPFVERVERAAARVTPTRRCAGAEYPIVATGASDFALYWRTLVWDHAPGALLLREAGGVVQRLDGSDYRPGDARLGLLLARSPEVAKQVLALR